MFNTDTTTKVLLMDIKQASHGLHVAAASRVYFVGPVWDISTEAQAIKRAHRIGQTKPVYVETLVLEDTIEDRMWRRRKRLSEGGQDFGSKKGWLDDEGVVGIIKNERFLPVKDGEERDFPRLDSDEPLFGRARAWENDEAEETGEVEVRSKKKMKKGVRFAEEDAMASGSATEVGRDSIFGGQERHKKQVRITVEIPGRSGGSSGHEV